MREGLGLQHQLAAVVSTYYETMQNVDQTGSRMALTVNRFNATNPAEAVGFDLNNDSRVDASEMVAMLNDLGLLHPYAFDFLNITAAYEARGEAVTVAGLTEQVILLRGNRARLWVSRNTNLRAIRNSDADVNGDGTIDVGEALAVLRDSHALIGSGGRLFDTWTHLYRITGGGGPGGRFFTPAHWADLICQSTDIFTAALVNESQSMSMRAIDNMASGVAGLMDGVSIVGAAVEASVSPCNNTITGAAGIMFTPFTGGAFVLGTPVSVVNAARDAVRCAEGARNLISSVEATFVAARESMQALRSTVEGAPPLIGNWLRAKAVNGARAPLCPVATDVLGSATIASSLDNIGSAIVVISRAASRLEQLSNATATAGIGVLKLASANLTDYRAQFNYNITTAEQENMEVQVQSALEVYAESQYVGGSSPTFAPSASSSAPSASTVTPTPSSTLPSTTSVPSGGPSGTTTLLGSENAILLSLIKAITRVLNNVPEALVKQAVLSASYNDRAELRQWVAAIINDTSTVRRSAAISAQYLRLREQSLVRALIELTQNIRLWYNATTLQDPQDVGLTLSGTLLTCRIPVCSH